MWSIDDVPVVLLSFGRNVRSDLHVHISDLQLRIEELSKTTLPYYQQAISCMSAVLERLQARVSTRLASRTSSFWICPSCRADIQRKRRFHVKQSSAQGNLELQPGRQSASPPPHDLAKPFQGNGLAHDAQEPKQIATLAQEQQWRAAQRRGVKPLQEVFALGHSVEANLAVGLKKQDSIETLASILQHQDDPEYLQSLTTTAWTEIWRAFNPQNVFPGLHRHHRSLTSKSPYILNYSYDKRRQTYMRDLATLIRIRQQHGPLMDVIDYRLLLTYVARIGDEQGARGLWADMKTDGVKPDRECYNRFMEALVWDENARLKQARRSKDTIPKLRPQFTDIAMFRPGLSGEITMLFNEMSAAKLTPDVATICVLMTSLARDGEFAEATRILERVWSVDVHAMLEGAEMGNLQRIYPPTSPLCPTSRLFTTIAEVFGIANEIPAGLRVIDYISRQHRISLDEDIWYQVLRWAWLQARIKPEDRRVKVKGQGTQINMETVGKLFDVMMSEDYNVRPSMDLYDMSFKTLMLSPYAFPHSFEPDYFLRVLRTGRAFVGDAKRDLNRSITSGAGASSFAPILSDRHTPSKALTRSEVASLKHKTSKGMLDGWLVSFLRLPRSKRGKFDYTIHPRVNPGDIADWRGPGLANLTEWYLRGFQAFVKEWYAQLPALIKYTTHTGVVELDLGKEVESKRERRRRMREGETQSEPTSIRKLYTYSPSERASNSLTALESTVSAKRKARTSKWYARGGPLKRFQGE